MTEHFYSSVEAEAREQLEHRERLARNRQTIRLWRLNPFTLQELVARVKDQGERCLVGPENAFTPHTMNLDPVYTAPQALRSWKEKANHLFEYGKKLIKEKNGRI